MLRSIARTTIASARGLRSTHAAAGDRPNFGDETFDVCVVGGGVMGSWAAARAAERGASVALLEQYEPASTHGSSHGDGRIFRFAYEEAVYVDMMELSLKYWKELQASESEPLLATTGGLNIAPRGSAVHLERLAQTYDARGLDYERLSAAAVFARFPQYQPAEHLEALFQPDYGVLFASKATRATWERARRSGARVATGARVERLCADGDAGALRIEYSTAEGGMGAVRSKALVLAPGAWLSGACRTLLGVEIPTRVTAETVSYYAPRSPGDASLRDHSYRSMPVACLDDDNGLGQYGYYCLPAIDVPGVKISAHYCGPEIADPSARATALAATNGNGLDALAASAGAVADGGEARIRAVSASNARCAETLFSSLDASRAIIEQSCLYTSTADHDYVLSRAPRSARIAHGGPTAPRNVVLAGGGSGHAFKMGPAIGECAACLALGEPPPLDIARFDAERLLGGAFAPHGSAGRK